MRYSIHDNMRIFNVRPRSRTIMFLIENHFVLRPGLLSCFLRAFPAIHAAKLEVPDMIAARLFQSGP